MCLPSTHARAFHMQLHTENGFTTSEVMVTAGANQVRSSSELFGLGFVHSAISVAVYVSAGLTLVVRYLLVLSWIFFYRSANFQGLREETLVIVLPTAFRSGQSL